MAYLGDFERWANEELQRRTECRNRCEAKHGMVGHPKADELWNLAYEHGHSAGFSEVEIYYSDFVRLVK